MNLEQDVAEQLENLLRRLAAQDSPNDEDLIAAARQIIDRVMNPRQGSLVGGPDTAPPDAEVIQIFRNGYFDNAPALGRELARYPGVDNVIIETFLDGDQRFLVVLRQDVSPAIRATMQKLSDWYLSQAKGRIIDLPDGLTEAQENKALALVKEGWPGKVTYATIFRTYPKHCIYADFAERIDYNAEVPEIERHLRTPGILDIPV